MQSFEVSQEFRKRMDQAGYQWKSGNGECMGSYLAEDLFFFREDFHETDESILLERNIIDFMPRIVTSRNPLLRAAKINIQHEFARAVESIRRGREYAGKNLLYIAGLNIRHFRVQGLSGNHLLCSLGRPYPVTGNYPCPG